MKLNFFATDTQYSQILWKQVVWKQKARNKQNSMVLTKLLMVLCSEKTTQNG